MSDVGADLSTVETVTVEGYEVRVARTADGTAWQAVVTDADSSPDTTQLPGMLGMMATTSGSGDTSDADPDGPSVIAPHRWVAIGFAIEAYEWGEINESPGSVADAYGDVTVNGTDLLDLNVMEIDADELAAELEGDRDD